MANSKNSRERRASGGVTRRRQSPVGCRRSSSSADLLGVELFQEVSLGDRVAEPRQLAADLLDLVDVDAALAKAEHN